MRQVAFCFWMTLGLLWAVPLWAEPAPETLRQTIRGYIARQEELQGGFVIYDKDAGDFRQLELVQVHERVGKTGDYYYSCTDMEDKETGDLLDLDFDIKDRGGVLEVADIRFHKDNGIPRYTYDANDQRIPVLTAEIHPTGEGSSLSGVAAFIETVEGLKISAFVSGAPPGKHGFHIHEKGDCGDAGNAAGGHFNPDGVSHGDLERDGLDHAHAGDLGNIEIGPEGKGTLEKVIPRLTLKEGKYAVAGRALVLHEKEDDFSQPTGNAGGRIACGIIPSSP